MKKLLAMVTAGFIVCPLFGTLSDGLVAYYKFDGNANDASGNYYDLYGGAATWGQDRNGVGTAAAYFTGNAYYTPSTWYSVLDSMTISVWVKPTANISLSSSGVASFSGAIIYPSHGGSTGRAGLGVFVGKNGVVVGEHASNYNPALLVYSADIGEAWTLVTVTVSGNGAPILYVNGIRVATGDASPKVKFLGASNDENDSSSLIGGGRTYYYKGAMDDLRIYNRTLSSAEVKALYDGDVDDGDVAPVVTKCTVTSATARQRYPWNGLVDITVTIQGSAADMAETVCSFAATNGATKAALPVVHVTQNGADTGSGTTWTRKFIWDTNADVGEVKIDDVALTVDATIGVQLWENGPYWAKCNVGATKPEECGYYFWWGDTVGYKCNSANNGWVSAKDGSSYSFFLNDCPTYYKDNSQLKSLGYIDSTGNLVAAYDAATAHLGAPWRMPTDAEFDALIRNCTTTWTTRNGVAGRLVTGKGAYASKSIFLPAAGYGGGSYLFALGSRGNYWSSTPNTSDYARNLYFGSHAFFGSSDGRFNGYPVRPVRGFAK